MPGRSFTSIATSTITGGRLAGSCSARAVAMEAPRVVLVRPSMSPASIGRFGRNARRVPAAVHVAVRLPSVGMVQVTARELAAPELGRAGGVAARALADKPPFRVPSVGNPPAALLATHLQVRA